MHALCFYSQQPHTPIKHRHMIVHLVRMTVTEVGHVDGVERRQPESGILGGHGTAMMCSEPHDLHHTHTPQSKTLTHECMCNIPLGVCVCDNDRSNGGNATGLRGGVDGRRGTAAATRSQQQHNLHTVRHTAIQNNDTHHCTRLTYHLVCATVNVVRCVDGGVCVRSGGGRNYCGDATRTVRPATHSHTSIKYTGTLHTCNTPLGVCDRVRSWDC